MDAFVCALGTIGYEPCGKDAALEPSYQKVAIYASSGRCKHVARQLPNGTWTSKLGDLEDIVHASLDGVEGTYGQVELILRRAIAQEG